MSQPRIVQIKLKKPKMTYAVMVICTAVTLLAMFWPGLSETDGQLLLGAYYKAFISAGEWWRLLTASFLHTGILHLFVNMYSLYIMGSVIEQLYGRIRYGVLLFGSGTIGYLFQYLTAGNSVVMGLSGGLYGLLAAYLMLIFKSHGWRIPQVRLAVIQMLFINLMINFMPGIGWRVHIGGFISGLLLSMLLSPDPADAQLKKNTVVAFTALVIAMFALLPQHAMVPYQDAYLGTDLSVLKAEKNIGLKTHAEHMAENLDEMYGTSPYLQQALKGD